MNDDDDDDDHLIMDHGRLMTRVNHSAKSEGVSEAAPSTALWFWMSGSKVSQLAHGRLEA